MKKNLTEKKIEPTLDEPTSDQANEFQDNFDDTMAQYDIRLTEIDTMLNEKEQSLKKKIFNLAKMESLVHADPKLSAVYNEMSENGEEKYGYHYNETIMNIIFNDYVLNSSKYLQKYKMAIPKEKKRRDKSGINQLKKSGKKKQDATGTKIVEPDVKNEGVTLFKEEEQMAIDAGQEIPKKEEEIDETTGAASSGAYVGPAVWGGGDLMSGGKKQKKDKKSFWDGGVMVQESKNYLIDPENFEKYFNKLNENVINEQMITDLKTLGRKVGMNDVPNLAGQALYDIAIHLADRYLPMRWDDLPDINSMWDYIDENGGMSFDELKEAVKEACNERLAEEGFDLDSLMEDNDKRVDFIQKNSETYGSLDKMNDANLDIITNDIVNGKLDEHHATTREEKIDTILQVLNSQDDGTIVSSEVFDSMSDVALDQTYKDVERMAGIAEQQLKEDHASGREQKLRYLKNYFEDEEQSGYPQTPTEWLNDLDDDAINVLYKNAEKQLQNLDEKAKSKAQQRFMGMVNAYKNGELDDEDVSADIERAADSMTDKEVDDFARTKHKELPEKVDEDLNDDLIEYNIPEWALSALVNSDESGLEEEDIQKLNAFVNDVIKQFGNANFMLGDVEGKDNLGFKHSNDIDNLGNNVYRMYLKPTNNAGLEETMIDNQEDSMKMRPPINDDGGDMPMGLQSSGPMNENKKTNNMSKMDENLKDLNKELELYEMHHKKIKEMNEDKKPSSLVLKDRLGKDNAKNFKSDINQSATKKIIDTTKELEWEDQQTEVPKDPYKLGKDIEKEVLKNTDGEAFENVGNSTNNEGDEIPKRNLTDEETDEVDLYRKGLGDFVFDNKPDERFEKRMERDMGEKNYKLRQERMKFNSDAPMYNKDTQPVDDGIDKVQFDKAKSKWNERMGIEESTMSGKFVDELGKTRIFDFSTLNVQEVKDSKKGAFFKLDVTGMGNTYNNRVQVNEGLENAINEWNFYTDGEFVFACKNVQNLTESEHKEEKKPVNEQFDKMKHLLGYNPKNFTNTKNNKL